MRDYDNLPAPLRMWIAEAKRPWSARTALKSYQKAVKASGTPEAALEELDRLQDKLIAKDAKFVWGENHPQARD